MRRWPGASAALLCLFAQAATAQATLPPREKLTYGAEWRFVRAGEVTLSLADATGGEMTLETLGLVGKLYKVDNSYRVEFGAGHCLASSLLNAKEGRRRRETRLQFSSEGPLVRYLETDLLKSTVVLSKELEVPACVHDIVGGLAALRERAGGDWKSLELPLTDGKKSAAVRVERLGGETIKTAAGQFAATQFEVSLFNGVLYSRKGRVFVWLASDEARTPVQMRIQLPFYVGTITLRLEKLERP